jgi:hypothetical protein
VPCKIVIEFQVLLQVAIAEHIIYSDYNHPLRLLVFFQQPTNFNNILDVIVVPPILNSLNNLIDIILRTSKINNYVIRN